jgi:hypothetical protein
MIFLLTTSWVAGIAEFCHHAQLVVWDKLLLIFCQGSALNLNPPNYYCWITYVYHHTWLFFFLKTRSLLYNPVQPQTRNPPALTSSAGTIDVHHHGCTNFALWMEFLPTHAFVHVEKIGSLLTFQMLTHCTKQHFKITFANWSHQKCL